MKQSAAVAGWFCVACTLSCGILLCGFAAQRRPEVALCAVIAAALADWWSREHWRCLRGGQ
jgi:hypothetical protein